MAELNPPPTHPWQRMTVAQWAIVVVFFGLVLPYLILFGGIALLALWDAIVRNV